MSEWLDPKVDFVFKKIFGSEENKDVLLAFLNEALKETQHKKLTKIILVNTFIDKDSLRDKLSILDIRALTDDDKQINLEIQLFDKHDIAQRTLFYWSRMYADQLEEGQMYKDLRQTITINIVNFRVVPNDRYHNVFHLREDRTGHILTTDIEIHFLELPKLDWDDVNADDRLTKWLLFLRFPNKVNGEELAMDMPELKKAMKTLDFISQSKETRAMYEMRQKAMMDEASLRDWAETAEERGMEIGIAKGMQQGMQQGIQQGIQQGMQQGIQQGIQEVAKKLLREGLDVSLIVKATGLSEAEIQKLQS
ncbi:Rpn family recombination-promoting nuclease/putative transposase [Paenibacillus sp. HB172176]|uniref:Rpn family recombination-promoting nuclease/putative transposase n=1 Tax=Paenibacillus sp. HB172176 TaxID=2493690 RepID=UPI001438A021|nr:Rpn family recombination-promoting nuclease/putative transposase [Paenibacillus sp. HB172176]